MKLLKKFQQIPDNRNRHKFNKLNKFKIEDNANKFYAKKCKQKKLNHIRMAYKKEITE